MSISALEKTDVIIELEINLIDAELKRPNLRAVVMLNDDYTPMEFVVDVLESVFGMDEQSANKTMLLVHYAGKAVCGSYPADIAETKAAKVIELARINDYPLLCLTQWV